MAELERFVEALLGNVVFLICLLPLVGAILTFVSGQLGEGHARSTALTNALLTLSLTLLMVANYRPNDSDGEGAGADIQMTSGFEWIGATKTETTPNDDGSLLGGMTIHFAVGVDGISLWTIVLTALLTVAAIAAVDVENSRQPWLLFAMLLLEQSLMSCLFAALDPVLFCVCLQLSLVPLYFLLGEQGGHERRPLARGFLILNLGGSLCIIIGLMAVLLIVARVAPELTLIVPRFMTNFADVASSVGTKDWNAVGPWILGAMVAGFAVRLSLFPWHVLFVSACRQTPGASGVVLAAVFPLTGIYGVVRFVIPLLDISAATWATGLQWWATCGAIYFGLLAWSQLDLRPSVISIGLSWVQLGGAGVLSLTPNGMIGGFLAVCGLSLSVGSLFLAERQSHDGRNSRRPSGGTIVALLSLMGIPGSAAFAGALLALWGLSTVNGPAAIAGLVGWLLCGCAMIRVAGRLLRRAESAADEDQQSVTTEWGLRPVLLGLLLAIIAWVGLYPEFFTDRMQSSVGYLYQTAVEK
jgi:NADH-quinone oxidoreductase subunit M